jgi:chromate transport protein ChrA
MQIFIYFAKAGLFVFGSGLAVVPFLYGGVVQAITGSPITSSSTPSRWQ